jgi:type II secretory pathway component PulC
MLDEIVAPLLTTEWGRRAGLLLFGLVVISLVVTVISMPVTWYADYDLAQRMPTVSVSTLDVADQAATLIAQIPQRHLFGDAARVSQTTIPITSLQLRLIGVIKADAKNASRVIISEAGQTGKVYQVGDQLVGGVKVSGIVEDGVILDNGGHLEKLPLQRAPLVFQELPQQSLLGE